MRAAEGYLAARNVDAPRRSVELLFGRVLGLSRLDLYLAHDRPVDESERIKLRECIARRGQHVPVAYLLGDWDFYGLELFVTPAVLVPRPETEGLVERIIERAPQGARCIDLGTGSGAIAIALASKRPDVTVVASDVSADALAVARRNVERHALRERVELVHGSHWQPLLGRRFDVVISNPPYVDPARPDLIGPGVREHEPSVALFTPAGDPAAHYREIVAGLGAHGEPGGLVAFETGIGAAEPALAVLTASPFLEDARLESDLAGQPRYLSGRLRAHTP